MNIVDISPKSSNIVEEIYCEIPRKWDSFTEEEKNNIAQKLFTQFLNTPIKNETLNEMKHLLLVHNIRDFKIMQHPMDKTQIVVISEKEALGL